MPKFKLTDIEEKIMSSDLPWKTRGGENSPWPSFVEKFGLKPFVWIVREVAASGKNGAYVYIPGNPNPTYKLPWSWNKFILQFNDDPLKWLSYEFDEGMLGNQSVWVPSYESIIKLSKFRIISPSKA